MTEPEAAAKLDFRGPGHRRIVVYELLFGAGRICITNARASRAANEMESSFIDEEFMYDRIEDAMFVCLDGVWDGCGEPPGWIRHQPTGRRRPIEDARQVLDALKSGLNDYRPAPTYEQDCISCHRTLRFAFTDRELRCACGQIVSGAHYGASDPRDGSEDPHELSRRVASERQESPWRT